MSADRRLAVYGSLAPGQSNHHELTGLAGHWRSGVVRGWKVESGWGAAQGYPGLRPDPAGPDVAVQVFSSADLPAHWARLDAFEGAEYQRVVVTVVTADGPLDAQIYALRPEPQAAASRAP
ncbi:MAG: gamma-glutamylcyclotransferase family protein [Phenylobacterium sp.]|nr:gamma-glutamylcyclotransferase family protein [Phenylobacterium sp.]